MLPSRPFYLIRHGQSEANLAGITAGGKMDTPLTKTGREQARMLTPLLTRLDIKPQIIYHSSMSRARDTAALLNDEISLPMTEIHDLREHELGLWEVQPWDKIKPLLDNGIPPPEGETQAQFSQRIQAAFMDIFDNDERLPMIVAHGGVFHALGFLYEYGMSSVQNCHLHYFEPHEPYKLFPWRVWQFDIVGDELKKTPAPFCLSQTMAQIA